VSALAYLRVAALSLAALFAAALAVSIIVDPFGISPLRNSIPGLNAVRTERTHNDRLVKPFDPILRPAAIILMGSSRIKEGVDPEAVARLSKLSVYNAGVDDQRMADRASLAVHYIRHVRGLKRIYIELLGNLNTLPGKAIRLIPKSEHVSNLLRMLLSVSAQRANLESLYTNALYRSRDGTPFAELSGFFRIPPEAPCANCALNAFADGQWRQLDLNPHSDRLIPVLRHIREEGAQHGVQVYYFLSPMHAWFLYSSVAAGQWEALEESKRKLALLGGVRDFLRYNAYTDEYPAGRRMRYWMDAWHFTPELGELVMQAMMAPASPPDDFGRPLDPATIEAELAAFRSERDAWIARNPDVVERYRRAAASAGRPVTSR
jgi:hypothetical protein